MFIWQTEMTATTEKKTIEILDRIRNATCVTWDVVYVQVWGWRNIEIVLCKNVHFGSINQLPCLNHKRKRLKLVYPKGFFFLRVIRLLYTRDIRQYRKTLNALISNGYHKTDQKRKFLFSSFFFVWKKALYPPLTRSL